MSSLYGAADAADIPDRVISALADIFAGEIDFYHDVRRGDRFSVLYEMRYVDGELVGYRPDPRRRVRQPRHPPSRVLLARRRRHRQLLHRHRPQRAQHVPALADGAHAHYVRIHDGALPSRAAGLARAQGGRLRGAQGNAGARDRRRRGCVCGLAERLRQRGLRAHEGHYSTVYGHLSNFAEKPEDRLARRAKATRSASSA